MRLPVYIFLCGMLVAGFSWLRQQPQHAMQHRFTIVCTTTILADTIRNIVGEHARVISLMGPGVDPHLYRPREGDVHRLANADLVFFHGLHLEGKLATILESLERYVTAYAVSNSPSLPKELWRNKLPDPHIWHSVPLWMHVVSYIAECCALHDPVHAQDYYTNANAYIAQLQLLHDCIMKAIEILPPKHRILVTAHDAFAYFGQTYGLEVIALQGISTEAEIGTWDVMNLVDFIVQKKVPALFMETAIPHRTLQAVVDAVQVRGHTVQLGDELYADALGDTHSDAGTYIGMVKHNVRVIVEGLR